MMHRSKIEIKMNYSTILFFIILLIALGKVIRYSFMKTILVDAGIGHGWVNVITSSFDIDFTNFNNMNASDNSMLIYKLINVFNLKTYEGFELVITILYSLIIYVLLCRTKRIISIEKFIFLSFSVIVLSIFDFTLAKEPIQMIYFIVMYLIILNNNISDKAKNSLIAIMFLIISITFRNYYILAVGFYIVAQLAFKIILNKVRLHTIFKVLIFLFIMGFSYYILLVLASNIMPDVFNELIRVRTRSGSANTEIVNIFGGSNLIIFAFNYILIVIRLMFPIELIFAGVKYFPFIVYQFIITALTIKSIKNISTNLFYKNIALYLYIGFLFCSATFEPDFGSWIRHEGVLFPIFLIMADIKEINIKNNGVEKKYEVGCY